MRCETTMVKDRTISIIDLVIGFIGLCCMGIFLYIGGSCPVFSTGWSSSEGFIFEWDPKNIENEFSPNPQLECNTFQIVLRNLFGILTVIVLIFFLMSYFFERYKEKLTDNDKEVSS